MSRLALLLPAVLLAVSAAEAPRLECRVEGDRLKIRLEAASLPPGTVLRLGVRREPVTPTQVPTEDLAELLVELAPDGSAEGEIPLQGLQSLGRFRIEANSSGPKGEAFLDHGVGTRAYLQAVLEEQAFLEGAFTEVEGFLAAMAETEAQASKDRPAAVRAWKAGRAKALKGLEAILSRGRDASSLFFPETYTEFCSRFVATSLSQDELAWLQALEAGAKYDRKLQVRPTPLATPKYLEACKARFCQECAWERLAVMKAMAARLESREGKRAQADEVLALWGKGLEGLPWKKDLEDLGKAFAAWMDAEGGAAPALKAALVRRFSALQDATGWTEFEKRKAAVDASPPKSPPRGRRGPAPKP